MHVQQTPIAGCIQIMPKRLHDARGSFVKVFHADTFAANGLETHFQEEFVSTSGHGVLRGMHFQVPPADHAKLVTCLAGRVLDVALDLRRDSSTYGQHFRIELDASEPSSVYLAPGLAHGFLTLSDQAMVSYLVSTVHSPEHDAGVRWDSFGCPWPVRSPLLSERDAAHPTLEKFETPFRLLP